MRRFSKVAQCAVGLSMWMGAAASGAFQFQLDMNGIRADVGGAFGGETHTGTITLGKSPSGGLSDMLIDGESHALSSTLTSLTGSINLVNGQVTGGMLDVLMADGSQYTAMIASGSGEVNLQPGEGFSINAGTLGGLFPSLVGGTEFAGVDMSQWKGAEPIQGSFRLFAFSPDGSGVDVNTNLDVFGLVPAPGSTALALVALGSAALRRRRAGAV